jgi:hypothetical protein
MKKQAALIVAMLFIPACGENIAYMQARSAEQGYASSDREKMHARLKEQRILPQELAQALAKVGIANAPVVITVEPTTGKIIVFEKEKAREIKFPLQSEKILNVYSTHIFTYSYSTSETKTSTCWPSNGYQKCSP